MARKSEYWNRDLDESDTSSDSRSTDSGHLDTDATDPENDLKPISDTEFKGNVPLAQVPIPRSQIVTISKTRRYQDPDVDTDEELGDIDHDRNKPKGTKDQLLQTERLWHRFCTNKAEKQPHEVMWKKPEDALKGASADNYYAFLNWRLKLEYNENGRKNRMTSEASSLGTYFKYLRIHYSRVTKKKMSKEMRKDISAGMPRLVEKFKLGTVPRPSEVLYLKDMTRIIETILTTREKRFHTGEQRIMFALALMLGLFTGSRKTAILKLQYKHLRLSLIRNPRGGPPVITIEVRPEHVKGSGLRLPGQVKLNTFSFPEIIYGPSHVLCVHNYILGLLIHARAFQADIKSQGDLRKLFIMRGCEQLELPLKEEMDDHYLLCTVKEIDGEIRTIRTEHMSDSFFYSCMRSVSLILGLPTRIYFHMCKSTMGHVLDKANDISEAERTLVLYHKSTSTFLEYYAVRNHTQLQQKVLGQDSDYLMDQALKSIFRFVDKERPRYLNNEERTIVERDPQLQDAIREQDRLQEEYESNPVSSIGFELAEAKQNIVRIRARLRYQRLKKVREEFSRKKAVQVANGQLAGTIRPENDTTTEILSDDNRPPEMVMLAETLLAVATKWTFEAEWQRRNMSVGVIVMYCDYKEGGPLRGRPKRKRTVSDDDESLGNSLKESQEKQQDKLPITQKKCGQDKELVSSLKAIPKPTVCFQCGKEYSQHQSLLRHFRPKHLNDRQCNSCNDGEEFLLRMHWKRHAAAVHHLKT